MDKNIKKENMIPPSNPSYTSASKIESLKKYIKVPSSYTENDISELSDKSEKLSGTSNNLDKLSEKIKEGIQESNKLDSENINNLINYNHEKSSVSFKVSGLSDTIDKNIDESIENNNLLSEDNKIIDNSDYESKFNRYVDPIINNVEEGRTYKSPEFVYDERLVIGEDRKVLLNYNDIDISNLYNSRLDEVKSLNPNDESRDYKDFETEFDNRTSLNIVNNVNETDVSKIKESRESSSFNIDLPSDIDRNNFNDASSLLYDRNFVNFSEKITEDLSKGNEEDSYNLRKKIDLPVNSDRPSYIFPIKELESTLNGTGKGSVKKLGDEDYYSSKLSLPISSIKSGSSEKFEDISDKSKFIEKRFKSDTSTSSISLGEISINSDRLSIINDQSNNKRLLPISNNSNLEVKVNDSYEYYDSHRLEQIVSEDLYNKYKVLKNKKDYFEKIETDLPFNISNSKPYYLSKLTEDLKKKIGSPSSVVDVPTHINKTSTHENSVTSKERDTSINERFTHDTSPGSVRTGGIHLTPDGNTEASSQPNNSRVLPSNYNENIELSSDNGVKQSATESILSKYIKTDTNTANVPIPDHYSGNDTYIKLADWMGLVNSSEEEKINAASKYKKVMESLDGLGSTGSKAASYINSILGTSGRFTQPIPPHSWGFIKQLNALGLVRVGVDPLGLSGITKQRMLDELLALATWGEYELEKVLETNRDRLPGVPSTGLGKIVNGIKKVTDIAESVINGTGLPQKSEHPDPENRPNGYSIKRNPGGTLANVAGNVYNDESSLSKASNFYQYSVTDRLSGIGLTLKDLCNSSSDIKEVNDINELKYLLTSDKSLITTRRKVDGISKFGLDSNDNWELMLAPYKGGDNGGYSFLPELSEIRSENVKSYGLNIGYDSPGSYFSWIPATSFELQNKKLNQKSLSLYDGDISFPVSMEFTNELRISLMDDECKSFRKYFNKCAEVSVYNSYKTTNPTLSKLKSTKGYENVSDTITVIDRSTIAVPVYKNIAFQCDIYIMKGDKSTVKKFSFLVTLRDFQEEYSGEIDSSATELSLHFSIVGDLEYNDEFYYNMMGAKKVEGTNQKKYGEENKYSDSKSMDKLELPPLGRSPDPSSVVKI